MSGFSEPEPLAHVIQRLTAGRAALNAESDALRQAVHQGFLRARIIQALVRDIDLQLAALEAPGPRAA